MGTSDGFFGSNAKLDTPLIYYGDQETPGVYLDWDRSGRPNVATYNILRANQIDGTYASVGTVTFPTQEFIDEEGYPNYYYQIQELDSSNSVLGTSQPFIGEELLIRASLRYQVKEFLKIRVRNEIPEFTNRARNQAETVFDNWNYWPRPRIRINGASEGGTQEAMQLLDENDPLLTTLDDSQQADYSGGLCYKLDYQGKIYFVDSTGALTTVKAYNEVEVTYAVRLFTCQEMNSALHRALQTLNALPGTTTYKCIERAPYWYDAALICGATYFLYTQLLLSLSSREKRILLDDPDTGHNIDNLKEMVKQIGEDWTSIQKTLPKKVYPRSLWIIQPQFQLPGGRSRFFRELFQGPGIL